MLSRNHFMSIAHTVATAGTCSRLKVGALLVYSRRIISTGYNGAPAGLPHCDHGPESSKPLGPGQTCMISVHAEANAIAFAARHGLKTEGASMYVTDSPCLNCSRLIINAGIKEVIYDRLYRIKDGLQELDQAGVTIIGLDEPELPFMPDPRGNKPSVHPGKHADEAFERGWTEYSSDPNRRSPGI